MSEKLIRQIWQVDNYIFGIKWTDGSEQRIKLSDLQKRCPCAKCLEEKTEKPKSLEVQDNVRAIAIRSVGRYALKVQFTTGCSTGIYTYDLLQRMN